ncbi:serine protease [Deinococcus cavernae]|uniref:Serine protease n=1 Tax=Deinococcus cavernae TaxID=2320857 RepID=A0A418V7T7_9DEIO|nr:serine protease [Deinococcus cavernae]RJF72149.1 serine protease [Deinococcus cavernae]
MKRTLLCLPLIAAAALTACGNTPAANADLANAPTPVRGEKTASAPLQPLIVGGTISARGARPYQVAMTDTSGFQYCGGTLLSSTWVLTAAHCVKGSTASSVRIRAGVNKLSDSTQGQTVGVSSITIHPSYRDATYGYDIALLRLSTAVTNTYAAPAKLPSNAVEAVLDVKGKYAVVSGWGLTQGNNNNTASNDLREVSIPITPNPATCGGSSVPGNTICGEYYQGKDSCNGDSGGPLAQTYNGNFYVLGIVSYGPSACTGNGTYTRVNGYLSWIQQVSGITADGSTGGGTVTNYSGSVSSRSSSYKPGSTGFSYSGGTLKASLTGPSGTDFDLYLQKLSSTGTWTDVASSEGGTSSESINYAATSGTYRWEVYAYSGSGSYTLTETK